MNQLDVFALRAEVLAAFAKHSTRTDDLATLWERVAKELGVSMRTLYRYLGPDFTDLWPELEKRGWAKSGGPPRRAKRGVSNREPKVFAHIEKNYGEIDYKTLAREMNPEKPVVANVYTTLSEMKAKGLIALDGTRWFIVKRPAVPT